MIDRNSSTTSLSLINQARNNDEDAWQKMCNIYSPLVVDWVRKVGIQSEDVNDIVQDVFQIVFKNIRRFEKDKPSDTFRGWLWTITRNEIRGWFKKQKAAKVKAVGGSDANNKLAKIPDWVDNDSAIHELPVDSATEAIVVQRAAEAIKDDFKSQTWQAFWRTTVEGRSSTEIAEDLGITTGAVRQAKFRVLARLREYLDSEI